MLKHPKNKFIRHIILILLLNTNKTHKPSNDTIPHLVNSFSFTSKTLLMNYLCPEVCLRRLIPHQQFNTYTTLNIPFFLTNYLTNLTKSKTHKFPISSTWLLSLQTTDWILCPDLDDSILLMNEHLTKDAPKETLFKPNGPWLTNEDTKPYILEHLDNIKLSRFQCITTSIINYAPYLESINLEQFSHNFWKQLVNVINSNSSKDSTMMPLCPTITRSYWAGTVTQHPYLTKYPNNTKLLTTLGIISVINPTWQMTPHHTMSSK